MGIYDRDYYRDGGGWGDAGLRAVPALIAVTVGIFVVQLFSSPVRPLLDPLLRHGAFSFPAILDGEVWRVVTSFFVHDPRTLFGVVLGMLALYWFGTDVEDHYGPRRFLWLYLLAGTFVSGGKMVLGLLDVDPGKWTAGAGGPLFAVLTLCALHFPTRQILVLFVIPMPVGLLVVLLAGLYALAFATGDGSRMNVAVPLLGAAFGAAYYKLADSRFARGRSDDSRRTERTRPKLSLRVADPPDDDDPLTGGTPTPPRARAARPDEYLEAKLDAVLEKMARSGRDSLTAEENAVLLKASEVYRQKGK